MTLAGGGVSSTVVRSAMLPPVPVRPLQPCRNEKRPRRQQPAIRPTERPDFPEREAPIWKPLG